MNNGRPSTGRPSKKPMGKIGKILAIAGTVATLITALTPGILAWFDDTGDVAHKKAKESSVQAKKSEAKAEIAYELIKQKLEFLEKRLEDSQADVMDLRKFLRSAMAEGHLGSRRHSVELAERSARSVRRRPATGGGAISDDPLAGLDLEGAVEPDPEPKVPEQKALPNLEAEWKKREHKNQKKK